MEIYGQYIAPNEHGQVVPPDFSKLPIFPEDSGDFIFDAFMLLEVITENLPASGGLFLDGFRSLFAPPDRNANPQLLTAQECEKMNRRLWLYSTPILFFLVPPAWLASKINKWLYDLDFDVKSTEEIRLDQVLGVIFYARILRDVKIFIATAARHGYGISLYFA